MRVGLSKTRARWGCILVVLLAGCQSKTKSVDREPTSHSAPAAASGPKEARKEGPRADSPRLAFVKGTLREVAGGEPVGLHCVEGVLERGTPVVLLGIKEGRTCRLVAAERTGPVVGGGDCTALEGPCDLKGTSLGVIGVSEATVRSMEPSAAGGDEEERAKKQAAAAAKDLKPHDWCVIPEGPVTLTLEAVERPFGD